MKETMESCHQEGNKEHDQQGSLEKNRQNKNTKEQKIDWEQMGVQNQKRWNISNVDNEMKQELTHSQNQQEGC